MTRTPVETDMPLFAGHPSPDSTGAAAQFRCLVDLDAPCNLRCIPCPRTSRGRLLDEATATALSDRLAAQILQSGRKHVVVAYFGGEPLIAADQFVRELDRLGRMLEREGVAFRFALVTNGTLLTRTVAVRLAAAGLSRVSVTLWGCRLHHDRRRTTAAGAPTYTRVLNQLAEARRHLEVRVRYEMDDQAGLSCVPVLIADLLDRDCLAGPSRLRLSVQGPSSYAAQARSLGSFDGPGELPDARRRRPI